MSNSMSRVNSGVCRRRVHLVYNDNTITVVITEYRLYKSKNEPNNS